MTFRYTETGPVGLVENTRALVVSPRGGMHGQRHRSGDPYMRTVLGFIGINEVDFIYAEGMGMARRRRPRASSRPRSSWKPWHTDAVTVACSPRSKTTQPSGCVVVFGRSRTPVFQSQEATAAAADHQADHHQGSQQQGGEPPFGTLGGNWGEEADHQQGADDDQAGGRVRRSWVVLGCW